MERENKILIIDDSETNLVLLEAILEDEGFEVQTAFSAREAEGLLKDNIPDVILLDLLMPNENGFDLLKKLKQNTVLNEIPVIIVTAFANDENRFIAKDLGAEDVIEKPIDIPVFVEKVQKVLHNSKINTKR